jgi:hypothetical protein
MQRATAVRINADAVAVQPVCAERIALEHFHVDSGANQTMCQGEPSRAGADHKDAW